MDNWNIALVCLNVMGNKVILVIKRMVITNSQITDKYEMTVFTYTNTIGYTCKPSPSNRICYIINALILPILMNNHSKTLTM